MEIGAVVDSSRENALSGIWSAFGNASDDAGSLPNSDSSAVGVGAGAGAAAEPNAPTAAAAFVGPRDGLAAVPPATTEDEFDEAVAERMNNDRRSMGWRWNSGATSSTTWYWFSWVNIVDTCRCPYAS